MKEMSKQQRFIFDTQSCNKTSADFSIKYLLFKKITGSFRKISGIVSLDTQDLMQSLLTVNIDTRSLKISNSALESYAHNEIFRTHEFPYAQFRSTKVEATSDEEVFCVTGDLTVRGVTHEETMYVKISQNVLNGKIISADAQASLIVSRAKYGLVSQSFESVFRVSDSVSLDVEIHAIAE